MKKKAKRYQSGGLAGIAQTAQDLMGQVDNAAETIKTGVGGGGGGLRDHAVRGVGFTAQPIFESEQSKFANFGPRPQVQPRFQVQPRQAIFPASGMPGAAGFKKGGAVKSASARADGIAIRGKTRA